MSVIRAEPVPLAARIAAIDVLRGVALFGILVVNAAFFGVPFGRLFADPELATAPLVERVMASMQHMLFDGKFISIFSFLFGAGLALQMARLDAARREAQSDGRPGRSTVAAIMRRLGVLWLVGISHALLLWYGDILFYYATLGCLLVPARHRSVRTLVSIALCLIGVSFLATGGFAMAGFVGSQFNQPATVNQAVEAAREIGDPVERLHAALKAVNFNISDPSLIPSEIDAYRNGPFRAVVEIRALQWISCIPILMFIYMPHVVAMFTLGMVAAKRHLFAPSALATQRRAALIGISVGIALCGAATVVSWLTDFSPTSLPSVIVAPFAQLGTCALALGYVGAIAYVVNRGWMRGIARFIANAGRMAFTVYLSETVVMTGLMYWWGFGLFGTFDRMQLFVIACVVWLALVVASNLWLRAFRMGPLEWLWRMATYLEVPKLRA